MRQNNCKPIFNLINFKITSLSSRVIYTDHSIFIISVYTVFLHVDFYMKQSFFFDKLYIYLVQPALWNAKRHDTRYHLVNVKFFLHQSEILEQLLYSPNKLWFLFKILNVSSVFLALYNICSRCNNNRVLMALITNDQYSFLSRIVGLYDPNKWPITSTSPMPRSYFLYVVAELFFTLEFLFTLYSAQYLWKCWDSPSPNWGGLLRGSFCSEGE